MAMSRNGGQLREDVHDRKNSGEKKGPGEEEPSGEKDMYQQVSQTLLSYVPPRVLETALPSTNCFNSFLCLENQCEHRPLSHLPFTAYTNRAENFAMTLLTRANPTIHHTQVAVTAGSVHLLVIDPSEIKRDFTVLARKKILCYPSYSSFKNYSPEVSFLV